MFHSLVVFAWFAYVAIYVSASPALVSPIGGSVTLSRRTDPVFPDSPPSCPICQENYSSIQSCAEAAPVLANFSMIIFNPGAFIDVIKCACADTFQSVFPQCVDCFIQTGQQDVLGTSDLSSLAGDIKNICGLESTLLGNVSGANSAPHPTTTSGGCRTRLSPESTVSLIGLTFLIACIGF